VACAWVLLQSLLERWHAHRCFMLSSRSSTFRRAREGEEDWEKMFEDDVGGEDVETHVFQLLL